MQITCQHCGAIATDRVMCPSCGRRMQPAATTTPEPPPPSHPPPAAPSYPAALPPFYPLPPSSPTTGPWGGPLVPVVLFDREVTRRISRLSVGFRLILAIPTILISLFLSIAGLVVAVVAWFAAVFTARVPVGLYNFLGYVTAYVLRAASYLALLTDRWPSVSSGDPYPVAIRYPGPERLNRAAVVFRLILIVPAYIVNGVVNSGLTALLFPFWLILLVLGRSPEPVFDAASAATRYQTRVTAYLFLLTSAYPTALFVSDLEKPEAPLPSRPELVPPRPSTGGRRLLIALVVIGAAAQVAQLAR